MDQKPMRRPYARGGPAEAAQRHERIMGLAGACRCEFRGTEAERAELLELRADLDGWARSLQELLVGRHWAFPFLPRMLRDSEAKLRRWNARLRGERDQEGEEGAALELQDEGSKAEVMARVLRVFLGLRDVWVAVCIKYCEAVAENYHDLRERMKRSEGIVDFDFY